MAVESGRDARVWTLTLGPEHPAGHGPIAFQLIVAGDDADETITWAEAIVHPLHRGAEKLFESRDYRQILMLADRHDWLSAFGSELGLALLLEAQLGLVVPERATWIRTLMAELNRAIHHLRWLGETVWEVSQSTSGSVATDESALRLRGQAGGVREQLTSLHEAISGGRMHPMLIQPGGLRMDAPDDWTSAVRTVTQSDARSISADLNGWAGQVSQLGGLGVVSPKQAIDFGTSGPVARASHLPLDLRLDEPYCAYAELADAGVLRRVTRTAGDSQARVQVLAEQLENSIECVSFCAERIDEIGPGPIAVRLPRSLRVPEGDSYGWTENPTGINGWYLVSQGANEPYRLKLRTASFANAQLLSQILVGTRVTDLPMTLMSFLLVAGDLGK